MAMTPSTKTRRQSTVTPSLLSKLAKFVSPELLDTVLARGVAEQLNLTKALLP
jgi:hypothetical protein